MPAGSYFKKRVYVGQRGVDGFSLGVDDISDILALLDSGTGKDAAIRSPIYFWDQAVHVMRPNDLLFGYAIRAYIAQQKDIDVYLPIVPESLNINKDDFLLAETPATVKNKIITPETNRLDGIEKFPDYAKSGKWQGNNFKGEGIMESLVHRDIPEILGDTDEGSFSQYTTSTVAETSTGNWVPNPYLTMGKFEPSVKVKLRLPDWQINTNRFYFGFVTAETILNNDVPFGSQDTALLMGFGNGDSDFKLYRGIGDGQTVSPHSTNVNVDFQVITLEFGFRDFGNQVYYRIDDGQEIIFTTNLPQNNKWLKLHCDIQNTTTQSKKLDIFWERMETKK